MKIKKVNMRLDVGDRRRVQLIDVDVEQGFIDFKKVSSSKYG